MAMGQGGSQAMEDAEVFSRFLLTTNISVEDALKRYEAERMERTKAIALKARRRSHIICGKDPELTQPWYEQLRQESDRDVTDAISKVILGGPFH
jgi:FAD-dependent urate hydroxylase